MNVSKVDSANTIGFRLALLQLLEALECDFELIRCRESGRVVEDFHPEE